MRSKSIITATLLLILATASAAWATPYFEVDEADRKDHYQPSDWITINIAIEDGVPWEDRVSGMIIDAIYDYGAGGTAAEPQVFNTNYGYQHPGTLNSNGMLLDHISFQDVLCPPIGADGILYSFEYHVPVVPASTIIDIGTFADGDEYLLPEIAYIGGAYEINHLIPVSIHIVPEPATLLLLSSGIVFMRKRK